MQFSSLFASAADNKCEMRNLGAYEDYILRLNATLDWLILNDRAKIKLATLAFLYCAEIVKNSVTLQTSCGYSQVKSLNFFFFFFDILPQM